MTSSSPIDRVATFVLAALLLMAPLLHSTVLSEPFALPKEIATLAAVILMLGLAIAAALRGEATRTPISAASVAAMATLLCAAAAIIPAANRGLALGGFLRIAAGVGVFWCAARFVRDASGGALLLRAILLGATLLSLGTIAQVFAPGLTLSIGGLSILPPSKTGASLGDAGLVAQYLILALPAGLGALALCRGAARLFASACLGLVVSALLFAGRPEGWIAGGLTIGLVVATRILQVFLGDRRWTRLAPDLAGESVRSLLIVVIVVISTVAVSRLAALLPSGIPASPLQGVSLLVPTTGDPRADRAAAAVGIGELLKLHPAGVGPGCFRHSFLEVAWTRLEKSPFSLNHQAIHAGNDFLERTAELGVAGGLAFVLFIVVILVQSMLAAASGVEPWGTIGFAALNAAGASCLTAFFGTPFEEASSALLFWTLAGLAQGALAQAATPSSRWLAWLRPLRLWPGSMPLGSRRFARVAAALWLGATALLGAWTWDRVAASRQAQRGLGDFYGRRYQEALGSFERPACRRSPEPLPRAWAGECSLRLGRLSDAAREFGEAIERSPWFIAAYLGRAAAYQEAGRYDLAENDFRAAQRIWPDNVDTRLALAKLDETRGMIDRALDDYRDVARLSSSLAEPYFRMGEIYMRRGQIDEAIEAYRVCGMKNPRYPKLQQRTGDAFYRKGLVEMALRAYEAAAAADEKDVDSRLRIANTHHALGQYCEAKDALEAARDLETDARRRESILELIKKVTPDCERQVKTRAHRG